jgi:hypothetical protein
MAYTAVEMQVTQGPLVAVFPIETGYWEARAVYALAIYRNPSDKDAANFIVPITSGGITRSQDHYAPNQRDVLPLLPIAIYERHDWWDLCQGMPLTLVRNSVGELVELGEEGDR